MKVCLPVVLILTLVSLGCQEPVDEPPVHKRSTLKAEEVNLERLGRFANPKNTVGELIYVPIYSSVYHRGGDMEFLLTATLSIHNVNLRDEIHVSAVSYFDTNGLRLKEFLQTPLVLGPLETKQFVIPQQDQSGGTGANFVVRWESPKPTTPPLVEGLMISTSSQQGLSFITQSTVIGKLKPASTSTPTSAM